MSRSKVSLIESGFDADVRRLAARTGRQTHGVAGKKGPTTAYRPATEKRPATLRRTLRLDASLVEAYAQAQTQGLVPPLTLMVERYLRQSLSKLRK